MELVYVSMLLSTFTSTNNITYGTIMCITSGVFFLVYFVPRLSRKHIIFQIVLIIYAILTAIYGTLQIILIQK